jgi:hypothetical protein
MPFTPPPVDSLVEEPKRKFTPPPANSLQAAPSKPAVTPSNAVSPDELEALQEKEDARQFGRENIGSEESEQGLARMVTEAKEHPAEIAKTPLALASLPFDMIAEVLPHLTPAERAQLAKTSPNWEKAEAAAEAVGKVAPLLLPVGAIMEAGIVGKALGALFGASAASELPQESAATGAVFGNPKSTPGEKILAGTDLGTTAAIAALGLSGPALEAGKLLPQSVQSTLDAKKATEPFATPAPAKPRPPVQPAPEVKPEEKPDIMPPEAPSVQRGMTQEKWNTLQDWQKKNVLQMIEARKQAQAERIKPPQPAAPPTVQPTKTPFVPPPPTSVVAPPPKDETTPPTTPAASPVEAGTPPVPVEETGKAPTTAPPVPATPKETEELTEVDTVKKARAIAIGEGGPTPISMGGRNPKDPGEIAESSLGQLSLSLQTLADSRKGSVRKAFDLGQQWAKTKDSVTSALSGLSAAGKFMQKRLVGKPEVTPLDESIGKRHLSLSESADIARRWVRTATKAMPDKELQAAISNWIDTGGDPALLQQGAAATKPQYRAGYERAMRLTPEERTIAENIKTHFEDRLDDAQREGILSDGIENYIHRMYERESPWKQGIIAELRSGLFTGKPALAKKRVFQYDFEAEKEGLAPVKSFIQRVAAYDLALNKAIADRQMVKDMMEIRMADGRPMISTAGWGTQVPKDAVTEATLIKPSQKFRSETDAKKNRGDYKVYDHPALRKWKWLGEDTGGTPIYLQGDALIHPDAVNRIHQLFDASAVRKSPVGRAALALSSTVKQTMLDLSGFHWVQVTVHGAEHRTFGPIKEIDWTNPDVRGLVSGGLVVGDTTGAEHFSEGLTGSSLTKFIPGLGPRLQEATHWLFNDYIPRLKVATGLHALERNRKRFQNLSDQELHRLTANEMNAAFGEQNYELLGRSKTMQDVLRLMFFSPDFTEARARFAGQAATWYGREQFTALALGAMALYVTARILNKYLDGQWHLEPKNAFNFVHNGKAYSLRTVQGDLVHAATDPNSFMFHRINPVFGRPVMEELTRRDEFGRKRTQGQIIEDFARNAIPISAKGFFNGNEQTLLESFMNSAGLTERRDSATEDVYDLAETWKKQNHVNAAPGEFIYDKDKDPYHNIRLAALNGGDVKKAIAQSGLSPSKVEDHFARSWQHAFAGSKANEAAFVRSLTEDQKALYQKAAQERKAVTERVLDALRK